MSKGPGKLQRAILSLLSGKGRNVYGGAGSLTTGELVEELQRAELVPDNRRAAAFRVYRACRSLYWHKRLVAELIFIDGVRAESWAWSLPP